MDFRYLGILFLVFSSLTNGFSGMKGSSEMMDSRLTINVENTREKNISEDGKIDTTTYRKQTGDNNIITSASILLNDSSDIKNNAEAMNQAAKKTTNDNNKVEKITIFSFFVKLISLLIS